MKKIILDTNFLLIPAQFKVDIFSEIERICSFRYEICVIDKTLDELNKIIKEQKGKHKYSAKLALQLIKAKKLTIIKTNSKEYTDNILLEMKDCVIATQDKELIKRLKKNSIKTITLRQKKYLIFN